MAHYTPLIAELEKTVPAAAREAYPQECVIPRSIPGVGKIIALTILLEVGDISRFQTKDQHGTGVEIAAV